MTAGELVVSFVQALPFEYYPAHACYFLKEKKIHLHRVLVMCWTTLKSPPSKIVTAW